jgi:hypothetical protein
VVSIFFFIKMYEDDDDDIPPPLSSLPDQINAVEQPYIRTRPPAEHTGDENIPLASTTVAGEESGL